ncbi:hypothetical protein [Micromonospora sp. RTGN7]|uniref:hypothetical protein n=1 Tax=Micromonospora sp. RTGN7 TaxID=3016526 RepID=UPI0029FF0904|nr:hypothetical protein [Micromonospora sp. RTGN7]
MRRAIACCAVTVLALGGLVGCGNAPPADRARPAGVHPLDGAAYYSAADQRAVDEKLERATGACMKGRGFTYPATPVPSPTARDDSEPGDPYGLIDRQTARTAGYDIVPDELRKRAQARSAPSSPPDPRYAAALVGDQEHQQSIALPEGNEVSIAVGACVTQARAEVFGAGWDRLFYTVQILSNMVIERTGDSPAVLETRKTWSSCAERAGYRAANPEELRESILTRARAATDDAAVREAARAELAAATADANCQEQADLREVVRSAQQRVEQEVLTDRFRGDLDELRQRRRVVLGH